MYKDLDINELEKLKKEEAMVSLRKATTNIKVIYFYLLDRKDLDNLIKTYWRKNLNQKLLDQ